MQFTAYDVLDSYQVSDAIVKTSRLPLLKGRHSSRFNLRYFIKFMILLLFICSAGAEAKVAGQRLTIVKHNAAMAEVIKEIERQSGYQFFFSDKDLRLAKNVSLEVHNEDLNDVLRKCFAGQDLTYEIVDKTVVIKLKKATVNAAETSLVAADPIKVTGKVTDEKGEALPGATVVIKGTKLAAVTDATGNFTISCNPGAVLSVSFMGYKQSDIVADGRGNLSIRLALNAADLEMVVAYGTAKKALYTGPATQIESSTFDKRPLNNVANALVGAAPGIQTTNSSGAPDAGPGIRLRGYGSYSASSSPLFVVDGVPYDGSISSLDPADIESLSVLKDATTSALYGSRAANGVVMITTKKGNKNKPQLNFSANYGIVRRGLPEYDRVGTNDYYPLMWEAYRNSLQFGADSLPNDIANQIASGTYTRITTGANTGLQSYKNKAYSDISQLLAYNPYNVAGKEIVGIDGKLNPAARLLYPEDLNWSEAAEKGGRSRQNYQLSYSGGSDKSTYYGSFGYTDMEGYLIKSNMKRFNGRLNIDVRPTTWFKTGMNIGGTYIKQNQDNSSGNTGYVNPFFFSRNVGPIYPVHAHDATGAYIIGTDGQPTYDIGLTRPFAAGRNAIYENMLNQVMQNKGLLSGRGFAEISILPYLKFTTNLSTDIENNFQQNYDNNIIGDGAPAGRSDRYTEKTVSYTFNQLLTFTKSFRKHNVSVLAGHENYSLNYAFLEGYKQGQIVDGITELPNFSTINSTTSYVDNQKVESYLSRATYDYEGKYMLSASLRRDGNSRFSPDVRWDNFWSVGAGWNLAREQFFNVYWVDQLKVRGSYGKLGNDAGLGYYAYQAFYNLGRNNGTAPGFVQGTLGSPNLKWETNYNLDMGIDFGFFKNRLTGTIDYFNRNTSGLIFSVPQPLDNGGTTTAVFTVKQNVGNMYNRGWELQLTGQIVKTKDFSYTLTVNGTTLQNKITKMPDNPSSIIDGSKQLSVGHSIYDYYLRHFYGVDPDNGNALYTAQTYNPANPGNTKIITNKTTGAQDTVTSSVSNAKLMYVGQSSIPKLYGSLQHSFTYKGLTLGIVMTYQIGGKIYDGAYASLMSSGSYGNALSTDIFKRWQKPGDITNVPRLDNGRTSDYGAASDRWLTSASYLNINNITLSYVVPRQVLSRITAKGATVYVSGENLHMFSARKGMDVNGAFNGTTANSYTYNRIITMGVNLNF
ncbi:SusC/RagA family TonB-linked outer membrane protein [Chitinophaga sp. Cy-1792]|uniref:SusC/RagA family TonB-linked outer membrane protein n=1 Tax=Chitinophaga sp. Cy-1792 TaxID=2608339 RepID=UPI0014236D8B|nr:SusC/RagA family TonB-linked outer membrane protein [Chitinophaga sp. Cy-1792]NIG52527.1 SusC/RagA family TonB-linked outer membrane protein [Chitinophaga sp. Cy-1792]